MATIDTEAGDPILTEGGEPLLTEGNGGNGGSGMQVITVSDAGTISLTAPYMFRGAKLTGATDSAQIQDGAAREIARLQTITDPASDQVILPSPVMVTGLIVVGLAGAGVLNIYVE